jgi:uncharacterized protein YejL (UPF0352 family)
MKTSLHSVTPAHRAFRDDMIAVLQKHGGKLSAMEMLALASHLVGQLIALQDQRKVTHGLAIKLVMQNIERGNQEAITESLGTPRGSA